MVSLPLREPAAAGQIDLQAVMQDDLPMGVALLGRDWRLRACNRTWARFIALYTPAREAQPVVGAYLFDLAPGIESAALPLFERVLAGETIHRDAVPLTCGGLTSHWDIVLSPLIEAGTITGIIEVVADVSARTGAYQELKQTAEALRAEQERFQLLMRGTNDGLWDWNVETGQSYFSPRWKSMLGYAEHEIANHVDSWRRLIHPDDIASVDSALASHMASDSPFYTVEHRLLQRDGSYCWVLARGSSLRHADGRVHRMVGSHTDISERKESAEALREAVAALQESRQALEQRVAERTRELATLLEVSHNVASTLELEPLLALILDQVRAVVDYSGASILTVEGSRLQVLAYRGPIPQAEALAIHFGVQEAGVNREVILGHKPVIIDDVRGPSSLAQAFRQSAGKQLDGTFRYIRSWLGVPLIAKGRLIGMLSFDHDQPAAYAEEQARLALAFADQVATAIDNARLYELEQARLVEAERRREVAEGLRDILAVLNSNRSLDETLAHIVAQAARLLGTDTGAIYRLDGPRGLLTIQAAQGLPADYVAQMSIPWGIGPVGEAVRQGGPVAVADTEGAIPPDLATDPVRRAQLAWLVINYRALVAVPLTIKDDPYGAIVLYYHQPRALSTEELQLAVSFADQAALAIENARLREQAGHAAVAAERSRLARDLHDAVTQTLFSASLIADVLPRIWERRPDEGRRRLEELRQLTRGALAEMRTLLLELRPSVLTEAHLPDLLRQLAEAVTGRARIPVTLEVTDECRVGPDVQVALYRIAQEALNNVAKHSGATHAAIRLHCAPLAGDGFSPSLELSICDDGRGFEVQGARGDRLGLRIMQERTETIGAVLRIDSSPTNGTRVAVNWPSQLESPGEG